MNSNLRTTIVGMLTLCLIACGSVDESKGMVTDVRVVINELVPRNDSSADADGNTFDWVELYNPADRTVHLQGFYVSDNPKKPFKFALDSAAVIRAQDYLVLWADGEGMNPLHLPFGLSGDGEGFMLSDPDGRVLDSVEFGAATVDQAYARFPNGSGEFSWCAQTTLDQDNGEECGDAPN
jgi:hypothetical protein